MFQNYPVTALIRQIRSLRQLSSVDNPTNLATGLYHKSYVVSAGTNIVCCILITLLRGCLSTALTGCNNTPAKNCSISHLAIQRTDAVEQHS